MYQCDPAAKAAPSTAAAGSDTNRHRRDRQPMVTSIKATDTA
jgi:hypothetical protein